MVLDAHQSAAHQYAFGGDGELELKDIGRKRESNDKSATRLHALIVEDSPLDAEFNVRALERAGFDVSCDVASMPEEVGARLRESRYDVILSDYRLQGWSGLETLKLVHENNLATPVVIVTGTLGDEMAVECLKHGAADYIRKDHLDRLPEAVRAALSRAAHASSAAELAAQLTVHTANMELVFDTVPDPFLLMDENCVIQRANFAASKMLGQHIFEIIGKPCYEIIHGTTAPPEDCPHRRMQLSGRPERGEISVRAEQKTFDLAVSPCANTSASLRGCVGIFRDTTSDRTAEKELRAANRKLSGWANQLEQRLKEMTLLGEMDDLLQLRVSATQTYGVLAHFGAELFGEDSGALRLLRPESRLLETVVIWGADPPPVRSFASDSCNATRAACPSDTLEGGSPCAHVTGPSRMKSLCMPVLGHNEVLGLLELKLAEPVSESSESSRSAAAIRHRAAVVAEHFGRALVSLRQREDLLIETVRDPLTGLFNRRYLEESLEREMNRATRSRRPLSIIMLDVDHFKNFNDTYGHAAGDAMLSALGKMLQARTRQGDVACRYGGEEFLLILPEAPLDVAWQRAEQLRTEAQQLRIKLDTVELQPVTLSLGVAAFPKHGATPRELLASADSHLYLAKNAGRDRVIAGEQIQEPLPSE
jgi:diguanylate cyclase (GGDEF)-like protein/PAS domain S-box-containing protein